MQKKPGICRAFFRAAISESATHVSLFCKIDGCCALSLPLRTATALDALIVALFLQRVGREKFVDRESNSAEQLAGICAAATTAAAGAFLFRHTIAVAGDQQLSIPLQPHNGELTQRDKYALALIRTAQLRLEAIADTAGNLADVAVAATALTGIYQLGIQYNGVYCSDNGAGQVALFDTARIHGIHAGAGGKYLRAAFAAEEDHAFVKHTKSFHFRGPAAAAADLQHHAVKITQIHSIESTVEIDRLHD